MAPNVAAAVHPASGRGKADRGASTAGLLPVSYTHLDVYKRQAHDLAERTASSREQGVHSATERALDATATATPHRRTHSDALLGAFAAITPVASAAIQALDTGDPARYLEILGPTEELSRQVFAAPTFLSLIHI